MKVFENYQNHLLSMQTMRDEVVNNDILNSIIEMLKILPTRDFEYSFLADYLMIIN